jgi:hypothetical protein
MPNPSQAELLEALRRAAASLPCLHGFTATVSLETKVVVEFACYECRQTMSYPPRLRSEIKRLMTHSGAFTDDAEFRWKKP